MAWPKGFPLSETPSADQSCMSRCRRDAHAAAWTTQDAARTALCRRKPQDKTDGLRREFSWDYTPAVIVLSKAMRPSSSLPWLLKVKYKYAKCVPACSA